jgi:2-oxo-4-hydroxy-4-carboxy-5-ureidoimidazoline decarboxylase
MLDVVKEAPRDERIDFLRAHPELAGKEAEAGTMTHDSVAEQATAGLDALSRARFTSCAG